MDTIIEELKKLNYHEIAGLINRLQDAQYLVALANAIEAWELSKCDYDINGD